MPSKYPKREDTSASLSCSPSTRTYDKDSKSESYRKEAPSEPTKCIDGSDLETATGRLSVYDGTKPRRRSSAILSPPKRSSIGETMFTQTELRFLKLLYTILDKDDSQSIEREELAAYAEESDDFAQQRELDLLMDALDSDGDGVIGLLDFILFAARLKEQAQHERFSSLLSELREAKPNLRKVSPK